MGPETTRRSQERPTATSRPLRLEEGRPRPRPRSLYTAEPSRIMNQPRTCRPPTRNIGKAIERPGQSPSTISPLPGAAAERSPSSATALGQLTSPAPSPASTFVPAPAPPSQLGARSRMSPCWASTPGSSTRPGRLLEASPLAILPHELAADDVAHGGGPLLALGPMPDGHAAGSQRPGRWPARASSVLGACPARPASADPARPPGGDGFPPPQCALLGRPGRILPPRADGPRRMRCRHPPTRTIPTSRRRKRSAAC
jgi:hypothetical protein